MIAPFRQTWREDIGVQPDAFVGRFQCDPALQPVAGSYFRSAVKNGSGEQPLAIVERLEDAPPARSNSLVERTQNLRRRQSHGHHPVSFRQTSAVEDTPCP
jgi:hypothetical protein